MNRKYTIDRPVPGSEEIKKGMNFDKLKADAGLTGKPPISGKGPSGSFFKNGWFMGGAGFVIALSVFTVFYFTGGNTETLDSDDSNIVSIVADDTVKRRVEPPLMGVNIPFESFSLTGAEDTVLASLKGSLISLDKNSFVDSTGNILEGKIEIHYRELHDPVDFFLSGIPMDYDSAGMNYVFESAGMIEMYAYHNGERVYVNPDKEIKIELCSDYDGSHYNLYYFDTISGGWLFRDKDMVVPFGENDIIASVDEKENMQKTDDINTIKAKLDNVSEEVEVLLKEKPLPPATASESSFVFDLDINPDEFPELGIYKNVKFEVKQGQGFTKDIYEEVWEDLTLGKTDENKYQMTLKGGAKSKSFEVSPVLTGADYGKALEDYEMKYSAYKKLLSEKKNEEKKLLKEYDLRLVEIDRQHEDLQKRRKEFEERKARERELENSARKTEEIVKRVFYINQFGIWNCDSPEQRPQGRKLEARFSDKSGKNMEFSMIYHVVGGRNTIISYRPNGFENFRYNPSKENMIWGVNRHNKLCKFTFDDFRQIPGTARSYTFAMHESEIELKDVTDIQSFLGLQ